MLSAYPEAAAVEDEVERGGDDVFPSPPMLAVVTDLLGAEEGKSSPNNLDYTAIKIQCILWASRSSKHFPPGYSHGSFSFPFKFSLVASVLSLPYHLSLVFCPCTQQRLLCRNPFTLLVWGLRRGMEKKQLQL